MKIELRNVSHSSKLSEETQAFVADVYVDGEKAGAAKNNGRGEPTMVTLSLLSIDARARVYAWVASLPPKVFGEGGPMPFSVPTTLDLIVDDLLYEYLTTKSMVASLRRVCKRSVCFRVDGDGPNEYRKIRKPAAGYTVAVRQALLAKYGSRLAEVYNETFGEVAQ